MKKITALIMALAMTASMAVVAFAEGETTGKDINISGDLEGALLTPGETYEYPVLIGDADITAEDLESYKTEVRITAGGSAIDSAKINEKEEGKYTLDVKVKAGWPTAQTNAKIRLRLLDKKTSKEISVKEISFKTGYKVMDDAYVNGLTQGEYITVDPTAPVITKAQLAKIAELNNYKAVTFTYGDWSYTVNVTDKDTINMLSNTNAIKEIMTKFENNQFKFVTFPAGTDFGVNGKVEIDVSAEMDDFDSKFFVYLYADGKLTKIDSKLDADTSTLSFTAKKLGRFVITDKEIKDTIVVEGSNNGTGTGTGNKNPNTGANDFVGVAAAMAVISLVAAGAVVLRKNSK